jgi:hypothetical protein
VPLDRAAVAVLYGTEYGFSKEIAEKLCDGIKATSGFWCGARRVAAWRAMPARRGGSTPHPTRRPAWPLACAGMCCSLVPRHCAACAWAGGGHTPGAALGTQSTLPSVRPPPPNIAGPSCTTWPSTPRATSWPRSRRWSSSARLRCEGGGRRPGPRPWQPGPRPPVRAHHPVPPLQPPPPPPPKPHPTPPRPAGRWRPPHRGARLLRVAVRGQGRAAGRAELCSPGPGGQDVHPLLPMRQAAGCGHAGRRGTAGEAAAAAPQVAMMRLGRLASLQGSLCVSVALAAAGAPRAAARRGRGRARPDGACCPPPLAVCR